MKMKTNNNKFLNKYSFGGFSMQRLTHLSIFAVILSILGLGKVTAAEVFVSGKIAPDEVMVFLKDNDYIINKSLVVGGTLIIEPGTKVIFYPNGRLIDSTGGRIIADGFAEVDYTSNPGLLNGEDLDPKEVQGTNENPNSYNAYSDLNYFLHGRNNSVQADDPVIDFSNTKDEPTVHASKQNDIFNVILDTVDRELKNLEYDNNGNFPPLVPNREVIVTYQEAMMFLAARMNQDPNTDLNLRDNPWSRLGDKDVNITEGQIEFVGQPTTNFSREFGHIVILPGARAAYFRNCVFRGMKKDTTVDRVPLFARNQGTFPWAVRNSNPDWDKINNDIRLASNGSGGAITTFSARTWLLNCSFEDNISRFKGGAVQFLEAPAGLPMMYNNLSDLRAAIGTYPLDKNPNITDPDGSASSVNSNSLTLIPAIDRIDEPASEPFTDVERMAYDDSRISIFLGRFRNNSFSSNEVVLADYGIQTIGNQTVGLDLETASYPYGDDYDNGAFGGAIYISGREDSEFRRFEIGLGVNHSINVDENGNGTYESSELVVFEDQDTFVADANKTDNRQSNPSSMGAKGGALYVGDYTSVIVSGQFSGNEASARYFTEIGTVLDASDYSQGGAIFYKNTLGRFQLRGGPERDIDPANPTHFTNNSAGAGGAIFVDGNTDNMMSPIIGGTDDLVRTRDYGFNIYFNENNALTHGGAVFSRRNMWVNGAGGVESNQLLGYGGKYPVRFWSNHAGLSGGGVHIEIPVANPVPDEKKNVIIRRASFRNNDVGMNVEDQTREAIRGGGAIYIINGDLNVVQATEFIENVVRNGNGAAIAQVSPQVSTEKFFVSDLDQVTYSPQGIATGYSSSNDVFTWDDNVTYPADVRMLTRFYENEIILDSDADFINSQMGRGTTQEESGTRKTNATLEDINSWDESYAIAVGTSGEILRIRNGGDDWDYLNSGVNLRLTSVEFLNQNTFIVVGHQGTILKTQDGGNTFAAKNSTIPFDNIYEIQSVGTQLIFAVADNGQVLKSVDAGETWNATVVQPGIDLKGLYFVDNDYGYVVGDNGTIVKTEDGGNTWTVLNNTINNDLKAVHFNGRNTGWVVGDNGTYAWTTDGGNTWNEANPKITTSDLYDVVASNLNTIYAVGANATILKSEDQGLTWDELTSSSTDNNTLLSISFASDDVGYIVADNGFVEKTEDAGTTWEEQEPADDLFTDVERYHQDTDLAENGIGLGGALYILDKADPTIDRTRDSIHFNRVRIQGNSAYSGAAVYSDNWDLKLIFNRSLITTNEATSEIGSMQNVIRGPIERDAQGDIVANNASSDLTGAIIYGEVLGPLPSSIYSEAANSIYNNEARFLIRLPDAPDTKGVLAGTTGLGFGGTDTLKGNYWGRTEANINVDYENIITNNVNFDFPNAGIETFFIAGDGQTWLPFRNSWVAGDDPREQGPHESLQRYNYETVPLRNLDQGTPSEDETQVGANSLPENLLFSGHVYDILDKGTDIKAADYSSRRMSPIEDFAVGIPPVLKTFDSTNQPSNNKYVKRYVRDPYCTEDERYEDFMTVLQKEYSPNTAGDFYHPIGQPLYLEAEADYDGLIERSNHDPYLENETVFFVINETTGDFIRANLKQVSEEAPNRETFRGRIEFVPDSSNRIPNNSIRRTSEGLFNFGAGQVLLLALEDNPYNEDGATLPGRKYDNNKNNFGNVPNIFSNRPDLPTENNDRATFFAGERFRSLPVNVGDNIRVVSRTVLWSEGVVPAINRGITFEISSGVESPQFTGDIVTLRDVPIIERRPAERENDPDNLEENEIIEYRNTVFLREDRSYPANNGSYGPQTRDSILSITAVDSNNYYDPRALFADSRDRFTYLTYEWDLLEDNSGLRNWIMVDTLTAGDGTTNVKDGAVGFQQFRGTPMNPYVVPGGESVEVTVYSYPPHFRTIDSLKATFGWENDNDTLAKLIELYPEYYHAESYTENARFLQQDTVDIGATDDLTFANTYKFDIFVVDSVPVWLDWDYASETITRNYSDGTPLDTQVVYDPSLRACFESEDTDGDGVRKLVANLTDKLRFQVDINTNDELEDFWAAKVHNWQFPYGRTAYGFQNYILSGGDEVVVDSTYYLDDNDDLQVQLNQRRPVWMSSEYLYEYGTDDQQDLLNQDFVSNGQINVRIDRNEALDLLTRDLDINGALNLDTTMSVVANDGHGGKTELEFDIFINIAPEIITETLEPAKEDERYNPQLINEDRRIEISDLNFEQSHEFELIYEGDYANGIPKDECFPEAGNWELGTDYFDTTPDWLQINPTSGLLYGTPSVEDAPRTETVSVLVTDSEGLTAVKTFELQVDSTNHLPDITAVPSTECFDIGGEYIDSVDVFDIDLLRDEPGFEETLTIEVIEPATGFTVEPSTIQGPTESASQQVLITSNSIPDGFRDQDGKGVIRVRVTDQDGNERIEEFRLNLSDPVNFVCKIDVTNSIGAFEELYWGAATGNNPTTGDTRDGDPEFGKLDTNFCEYELPPLPTVDIFDARWTHPQTNGLARTIYPDGRGVDPEDFNTFLYKATIQPGGENGNTSGRYPITVEWDRTCIPDEDDTDANPAGSNWYMIDGFSNGEFFTVEMKTGDSKGSEIVEVDQDIVTLTISNNTINSFIILTDIAGDVEEDISTGQTAITKVSPNPVSNNANIEFVLEQAGNVTIEIVDFLGNVVTTVVSEAYPAGQNQLTWDAKSQTGQRLADGYYNVRLIAGDETSTMPIRLVK